MTTTLVTGGGGFVGSHLCDSVLSDGHEVIALDNFGSGDRANVAHLREETDFTLVSGDVRDLPDLDLPVVERVYHLASRASPADFVTHAIDIALTNSEGTRHVLDYAVEADARVVYASTSEVYGDPEVHPQPESYNGNVNIRGSRACYDESKRFGETLAVAYGRRHGLDVRTARIFNTYGPRMRLNDGRVIPNFVTQAIENGEITVYGDGSQTRSFAYVEDTVGGIRALMETEGLAGEVVNIGQDIETTIGDVADLICELVGGGEIVTQPLPKDDPSRRRPDLTRARQLLDWRPTIPLEDGLERTIEYFRGQYPEDPNR
ncbi:Nucleoside-diphosphate-sugar epimerase [Halapricum desulfuricans]|uniref:Nucleoside-diphosphate-sugar epimerase n=1 Tax=Halapricum desulfuricans TaxID=2841257 RepID=A0A897NMB5_9EURY|nr:NAD-dependent epimerase/dehydratase family protein [Halapricum desulfuricans]QSG11356.1 Nucleoside-diphosphate-sugar epimerase [Halapricum desulfuricans]